MRILLILKENPFLSIYDFVTCEFKSCSLFAEVSHFLKLVLPIVDKVYQWLMCRKNLTVHY